MKLNKLNEKIQKLNKALFEQSKAENKSPVVASAIPHSSIERVSKLDSNRSNGLKQNEITSISLKKSHIRHASNSSNLSGNAIHPSHQKSRTIYDTKSFKNNISEFTNNVDKMMGSKSAFSTHQSVKGKGKSNKMIILDNFGIISIILMISFKYNLVEK